MVFDTSPAKKRLFYGWFLVPTVGFLHLITSVPLFHAMGLWFVALEAAFGWNRTQLSIAFSFTRIEGGFMGPVEGYLTDKLGTRKMVLMGLIVMGLGMLLLGQVRNLWMFYLAFVIMAMGQGMGGWLPLNTLLNNWFNRRRATAMGWSNSISRFGALFLIPVIAWAVDPEAENIGFRATATILGIFLLLVAFPVSRIIRDRPEEMGLLPDGDAPESAASEDVDSRSEKDPHRPHVRTRDLTTREALRTPAFWFISVGHGFTSMIIVSMMAHLAPMLIDQGHSVPTAGLVVTVYTAVSMVFQIVGGYVGDRIPKNLALAFFTAIQSGSVFIILFGPPTLATAYVFAVVFGVGFGGRNPLTTSIRGEYFGRASFGKIMGLSQVPMNIMLLIAPTFAGIMRDRQGDYVIAFTTLACASMIGGVLFLFARKPKMPEIAAEPVPVPTRAD
jgi:sugar phosphate permease